MNLTSWQQQIITGTLLGSSSIVIPNNQPNHYFMMVDKNKDWLFYKAEELKHIEAETPVSQNEKRLRWRSKSSKTEWLPFRENHYKDGKKMVKLEILDSLRDIGLAIWFGDKGYWATKKRIGLRTSAYGDDNVIIKKYFDEVGMPCEIRKYKKIQRIMFTKQGTLTFLKVVAHCLPKCMYFKLEY